MNGVDVNIQQSMLLIIMKLRDFLNSFFSQEFSHNKNKQIKELKKYIKNWNGKNNLILVTHYVVISEILNLSVSSGGNRCGRYRL